MKFVHAALIILCILFFNIAAWSYTRIYLLSDVDFKTENLLISDICKMEGDNIDLISGLVISPSLYSDGFIETKELLDFLQTKLDGKVYIFGNGIKVRKIIPEIRPVHVEIFLVKKGQIIGLTLRKNGITIEMKGKALGNGMENDEIEIKLTTGKIVKGRITGEKKADISI